MHGLIFHCRESQWSANSVKSLHFLHDSFRCLVGYFGETFHKWSNQCTYNLLLHCDDRKTVPCSKHESSLLVFQRRWRAGFEAAVAMATYRSAWKCGEHAFPFSNLFVVVSRRQYPGFAESFKALAALQSHLTLATHPPFAFELGKWNCLCCLNSVPFKHYEWLHNLVLDDSCVGRTGPDPGRRWRKSRSNFRFPCALYVEHNRVLINDLRNVS